MEYFVAESYTGWELVGAPFEKKGKMYTKARTTCDRCYKGVYVTRVENGVPVPHPNYGGVCLKCNGAGYLTKEIRLYTQKEKDAAARSKERAAERKAAERLEAADRKKAEWLERAGFDANGNMTVYIAADSYDIKDTLKANGWKYSPFLGWYTTYENAISQFSEDKIYTFPYEDAVTINVYGEGCWRNSIKEKLNQIRYDHQPHNSNWYGEVGERFYDLPITVVRVGGCETMYGWSNIITFVDEASNLFTWFTSSSCSYQKGDKLLMAATVKKHNEYNGEKTTVVTRATLKERS